MKLHLLFLLGMLFITVNIFSQKEGYNWYFGNNAGLNFSSPTPTILTNSKIDTYEGCSSISDKEGNLLFYTDGRVIYNSMHDTMLNGSNLFGNPSSTSSAIIIPKPGSYNTNLNRYTNYYVFSCDYEHGSNGINYSEIDMLMDNGLGAVLSTTKNIHLMDSATSEKITAIKHSNGCDYWFIAKSFNTPFYHAYLVNSTGVSNVPVLSSGPNMPNTTGEITVSPDQSMIAAAYAHTFHIEVYDFNRSNGSLSLKFYDSTFTPFGIEFSPDNSKLYVTQILDSNVLQYDLSLTNNNSSFQSSKVIVGKCTGNFTIGSFTYYSGAIQLAPNNKIYITNPTSNMLNVIEFPNKKGDSCNFVQNGQSIGAGLSHLSLPSIPSFYNTIEPHIIDSSKSCSLSKVFNLDNYEGINNINWEIIDLNGNTLLSAIDSSIAYTFKDFGSYIIKAILEKCYIDTLYDTISINSNYPIADFSSLNSYSNTDFHIDFVNQSTHGTNYEWYNSTSLFDSSFHSTLNTESSNTALLICLVAKNISNGCADTLCKPVYYEPEPILFLPNAFTPNGDGINDVFLPVLNGISSFRLIIYNKWGQEIFNTNNKDEGWDGTYKNILSKEDVYIWKAYYKSKTKTHLKIGHVTLLK